MRKKLDNIKSKKKQIVDVIVTILQIITLKQGENSEHGEDEIERMKSFVKESLTEGVENEQQKFDNDFSHDSLLH